MENDLNAKDKKQTPCILLAEDDEEMRKILVIYLKKFGYTIIGCNDGQELVDELGKYLINYKGNHRVDLIISDVQMPLISGLEVLKAANAIAKMPPMILITAFGSPELHKAAMDLGALAVFDKPFDLDDLLYFIEQRFPSYSEKQNTFKYINRGHEYDGEL